MNRRDFVSRVVLGGAAACTLFPRNALAATAENAGFRLRFVGMMGFVQRTDRSFVVATPGQSHHMKHVPFLMARAGTPIAKALGFSPHPGVVPEAFDTELIGTTPSDFVFKSLNNVAIDVASGHADAVRHDATQMAHMTRIAPGKRVKGNIEKWASATVSLRGGRTENSSAHPDAGRVWSFGNHRQRLTDAVNFRNNSGDTTTIRLTSASEARSYTASSTEVNELWMFSAAVMSARGSDPTRLIHSELVFDYLVDATPVVAECADATGRTVPPTVIPFANPTSAGRGLIASAAFPPETEICYIADFLLDLIGLDE